MWILIGCVLFRIGRSLEVSVCLWSLVAPSGRTIESFRSITDDEVRSVEV